MMKAFPFAFLLLTVGCTTEVTYQAGAPPLPEGHTVTMGRLAWDQIQHISDRNVEISTGSLPPETSVMKSREEVFAFGGVPFPSSEHVPKYRPNLATQFFPGEALENGMCENVVRRLRVESVSDENINSLHLYLTGLKPSAAEFAKLKTLSGIPAATYPPMELICAAIMGTDLFMTY